MNRRVYSGVQKKIESASFLQEETGTLGEGGLRSVRSIEFNDLFFIVLA